MYDEYYDDDSGNDRNQWDDDRDDEFYDDDYEGFVGDDGPNRRGEDDDSEPMEDQHLDIRQVVPGRLQIVAVKAEAIVPFLLALGRRRG